MSGDICRQFNTQITNFHEELEKLNIDSRIIRNSKTKLNLLKTANFKKVIQIYLNEVYIFKDHIDNRNIQFFKNLEDDNELFIYIKNYWENFTENTQNNIWLYFDVLNKICEQYNNYKENK